MQTQPRISDLIRDPALREIFRRAEGDDPIGELVECEPVRPQFGGAEARVLELA